MLLAKRKEEVQKKNLIAFLYTASTFLVMVVIVLGITLINHYDKLREMQNVITTLSKSVVDGQPVNEDNNLTGQAVQNNENEAQESTSEAVAASAETDMPQESEAPDDEEALSQTEANALADEGDINHATQTSKEGLKSYEIQPGDTLLGISRKMYNNTDMVKEICECNGIDNSDEIKAGDKIWLP